MGKQVAAGIPFKKAGEEKSLQNRTGIWVSNMDANPHQRGSAVIDNWFMGKQVAAGIPFKKAGEEKSLQNRTGIWVSNMDANPHQRGSAVIDNWFYQ